MPTVILLDVSLSMTRPVPSSDSSEEYQRRHLAVHGINTLLDYITAHSKLEFVSLVVFSSLWEQLVPFTRDLDQIKEAMTNMEDYDKTCMEGALAGVTSLVLKEWGVTSPCQVVLITDGDTGVGVGSLKRSLHDLDNGTQPPELFPLPFPFPSKLHVACIADTADGSLHGALPMYHRLTELNHHGEVFTPEGTLGMKSVQAMFGKLGEKYFAPFFGALNCGKLKCNVQVYPAPEFYDREHAFEHVRKQVSKEMEICGFLDIADVASPPFISRHLVLPVAQESDPSEPVKDGEEDAGEGKQPAFTVLLHGSLKVGGMVALVQLAEGWYGMMYSYADSKKKANLMLSVFEPGAEAVPWLGNLAHLAPIGDFSDPPYGEEDNKTPFPVKPTEKKSYSQTCVVWIKSTAVQADIQKILRHARKLPDKQQNFYKELNRVRRAALSFGFHELLSTISTLLERECTMLPGGAHPNAALQLTHAANTLRTDAAKDYDQNISPLRTNFTADS